jgi:hypothetical protein
VQKRFRFYDRGFTLFLNSGRPIKISIGIISPEGRDTGFLHCFAQYVVRPSLQPVIQTVDLCPYGKVYTINMSVYLAPSYLYLPSDDRQSESAGETEKSNISHDDGSHTNKSGENLTEADLDDELIE